MRLHRAAIALGVAWLCAGAAAHEAVRPELATLLQRADTALAAGRADEAQAAYEQAAALRHAARIEVGWVRARMQAGGYRQAIAFAAHVAGAHPDEPEGALLYARLLGLGGQAAAAQDVIARARQRLPAEPMLQVPVTSCPAQARETSSVPLQPPPLGAAVPAGAAVVGSAVLLDDARQALAPLALVDGDGPLWVRNGLGRAQSATVVSRDAEAGTALLQLAAPLDAPGTLARAPREAFPGSPAFVAGYRADTEARPAWPQLCPGFLGSPARDGSGRALGVRVEDGSVGAPVFDGAGRLVGLVAPAGRTGSVTLLPARQLVAFEPSSDASPLAIDELYERSLRRSLQLIRPR